MALCSIAWDTAVRWKTLDAPYKWVAAYYYYLVVKPLTFFASIWSYLNSPGLMPGYSNINLIIAVIGVVGYGMLLLSLVIGLAVAFRGKFFMLSIGPLGAALLWLAVSSMYGWLFYKDPHQSQVDELKKAEEQWKEDRRKYIEYFESHKEEVCLKERASFDRRWQYRWPSKAGFTANQINSMVSQHTGAVKILGPQFDNGCHYD